jgi:AcrR family transcriptional regulator
VDATALVVRREGIEAVTTKHVAKLAGVGVGTLYQYFATREALLLALEERTWSSLSEAVVAKMTTLAGEPLARIVPVLVTLMVTEVGQAVTSHGTVLMMQLPESARKTRRELVARVAQVIAVGLQQHRAVVRPRNLLLAAHLVLKGTIAFGRLGAEEHPEELASGEYATEIARMISAYLLADVACETVPG